MERAIAALLAAYGFRLSWRSTRTTKRLRNEAQAGSAQAARHFTQTRYARALGPRNSDLGMAFYGLLGLASASGMLRHRAVLHIFFAASCLSVGLSLYLLWALAFRLRVLCPICLQGHAVNLATFALLVRMRRSSRS